MPNSPSLEATQVTCRVSIEIYQKLKRLAQEKNMGFNECLRFYIYELTKHVVLTKSDYEEIQKIRRKNINKRLKNTRGQH